jgi:two-component system response regulator FixJ
MGTGGRVLVVDDDESMREAIESLLDVAGFESTAYAFAEDLLSADGVEDALCVITDVKLPAMSGMELLAELRARAVRPPVIIITAHDEPGVRDDALRRGAAAYLPKPFPGIALLAAIKSVSEGRPPK